jgi:predicted transcriptional regulator YheO
MREDDSETATLTCVNADEKELHEMVYFVNEFMGLQTSTHNKSAMSLN